MPRKGRQCILCMRKHMQHVFSHVHDTLNPNMLTYTILYKHFVPCLSTIRLLIPSDCLAYPLLAEQAPSTRCCSMTLHACGFQCILTTEHSAITKISLESHKNTEGVLFEGVLWCRNYFTARKKKEKKENVLISQSSAAKSGLPFFSLWILNGAVQLLSFSIID